MKLQHLRYFVTVAEEGHFGRAAERLGIGQPPLSLQIQRLEKELDIRLFRRRSRGVELTEAGELLLGHALYILKYMQNAVADVQRLKRGECGELNIGFAGGTYFSPEVTGVIHRFRTAYEGIRLKSALGNTPELMEKLQSGTVDAAFIRPAEEPGLNIEFTPVLCENMIVALPANHPLAVKNLPVNLSDLSEESFVMCDREIGRGLFDAIVAACHQAGFSPRLEQNAPQVGAIVPMVAAGFGISLVPASLRQIQSKNVKFLPLNGEVPQVRVVLATRYRDPSPALQNFVKLISTM
jgi:DNA-binding transcriptional LysR family regulator